MPTYLDQFASNVITVLTLGYLTQKELDHQAAMRQLNPNVNREPIREDRESEDSLRTITLTFESGKREQHIRPNKIDPEDAACRTRLNRWRQQYFR